MAGDGIDRLVQDFPEAARSREPLRHALSGSAQRLERRVQEDDRRQERDHPIRLQVARRDRSRREDDGRGDADRRHDLQRGREDRAHEEAAPHRREKAVLAGGKFVPLVPLHPKRLHDAYALQGLVQERVEGADLGLPPRGDLLQPPGEPDDGKDRERNGDERQQRQPPVESDGDAEQDQNLKTIAQVRGEAVGDGELHRRHVACEAREKIAR